MTQKRYNSAAVTSPGSTLSRNAMTSGLQHSRFSTDLHLFPNGSTDTTGGGAGKAKRGGSGRRKKREGWRGGALDAKGGSACCKIDGNDGSKTTVCWKETQWAKYVHTPPCTQQKTKSLAKFERCMVVVYPFLLRTDQCRPSYHTLPD